MILAVDIEWGVPILLLLILLLFGVKRIPEMARNLGAAKGEFEKGLREGTPKDETAAKSENDEKPKSE